MRNILFICFSLCFLTFCQTRHSGNNQTFYITSDTENYSLSGNNNEAYVSEGIKVKNITLSGNHNLILFRLTSTVEKINISGNANTVKLPKILSDKIKIAQSGNSNKVVFY
jgi:hypothetical protein